jgi:hypothetical protein
MLKTNIKDDFIRKKTNFAVSTRFFQPAESKVLQRNKTIMNNAKVNMFQESEYSRFRPETIEESELDGF